MIQQSQSVRLSLWASLITGTLATIVTPAIAQPGRTAIAPSGHSERLAHWADLNHRKHDHGAPDTGMSEHHDAEAEHDGGDHHSHEMDGHEMNDHEMNDHESGTDGHHHHSPVEIPAGQAVPTVSLTVMADTMSGWNVHIETTNFTFAPERVNQPGQTSEGHAHLYVNGEKVARLYGDWYHLESLPVGEHEVAVELNTNEHELLTHQGNPVRDAVTVVVPAQ